MPAPPTQQSVTQTESDVKRLFVSEPQLNGNEERYVLDCLRTVQLSMGHYVREFEKSFACYVGVEHAIACSSGTAALHLALLAFGVKPGDEVIIPTLTYVATANAVTYCGAKPVFCDVDPLTWCMDPDDLRRRVTKRTVGILPVHLYGHPANMTRLRQMAESFGLWVLEDAAEAHGATYKGASVGALGHAATFSFYGNKIITCGEGGMVTTNNAILAERMRLFRGQGVDTSVHRYHHTVVGYNYRMTNVQAAIGLAQLECIPDKLAKRKEIAYHYRLSFMEHTDSGVVLQGHQPYVEHANWLVSLLLPEDVDRDAVMAYLDTKGIETRPVFRCMHDLPMYEKNRLYIHADDISARGISLPTHESMTTRDVDLVVSYVIAALSTR
jgi:perosamine synthetase